MTHDFETLPDVLGALEQELRARASDAARASAPRRRSPWRPVAAVALAASCAVAGLTALPDSLTHESGTAYGQVPLLLMRAQPVPPSLSGSAVLREAVGSGGLPTQAWPFDGPDGTSWLMKGQGTWCLVLPPDTPGAPASVSCVKSASMQRYGIGFGAGSRYTAAIPEGVRNPVLHHADGSTTELQPDDLGIVVVEDLKRGETVTRFGTDGSSTTTIVPGA